MPEGPEVRRYAVRLAQVLDDQKIVEVSARTKAAKAWLLENHDQIVGRKVLRVRAHGKNLYAQIEGGFYFYSHLMMWGRWQIEEITHRVLDASQRKDSSDENRDVENHDVAQRENAERGAENPAERARRNEKRADDKRDAESASETFNRVLESESLERVRDRRERACISTKNHHAILLSAPVFEIGRGDARDIEYLRQLGPDILPYEDDGDWNEHEFLKRLLAGERSENGAREIGAALLDQTVCAGIGNYLRAEILFNCQINPFARISELSAADLSCLTREIPRVARFAYENGGATTDDESRERMRHDDALVYSRASDWGTRHFTFRRTNLPCLRCGDTIRQKRQVTRILNDEEKTRIIYFCPTCQNVPIETKPKRSSTRKAKPANVL